MQLSKLRDNHKLIDIFCELVSIPSPSFNEEKVADRIIEILKNNNIKTLKDSYGNIIAKVEATDNTKNPILLSAHMDVVGDDSEIHLNLSSEFIETDKKRTLGADDKAGVAAAILLAIEVNKDKNLKHGGLELVFTRDEEESMTGVKNLDKKQLESEFILVLDADTLADILISGASYTKMILNVESFKSGHSGIDIADKARLNSVKLVSELINKIPQGVYKENEFGVVTSINIGAVIGGGVDTPIKRWHGDTCDEINCYDYVINNAVTNVINTKAGATYSIRSSDTDCEKQLIADIQKIIDSFNKKYENLAKAQITVIPYLKPFEKNKDNTLIEIGKTAAKNCNLKANVSTFHAGAETHIYSNNTNKYGKKFKPCLLGLANIYNMHSPDEKIDYKSYLKGYEFLKEVFKSYNLFNI